MQVIKWASDWQAEKIIVKWLWGTDFFFFIRSLIINIHFYSAASRYMEFISSWRQRIASKLANDINTRVVPLVSIQYLLFYSSIPRDAVAEVIVLLTACPTMLSWASGLRYRIGWDIDGFFFNVQPWGFDELDQYWSWVSDRGTTKIKSIKSRYSVFRIQLCTCRKQGHYHLINGGYRRRKEGIGSTFVSPDTPGCIIG